MSSGDDDDDVMIFLVDVDVNCGVGGWRYDSDGGRRKRTDK